MQQFQAEIGDMVEVCLPLPPVRAQLNRRPVSRIGKMLLSREVRANRAIAKYHTIQAMNASRLKFPWLQARLDTLWYLPRRRDDDGLIGWMKSTRDGIADAGIVTNDSKFMVSAPLQFTDRHHPRLIVRVVCLAIDNSG